MINCFLVILILSTIGEFLPIPILEINQLSILLMIPYVYRNGYKKSSNNKLRKNLVIMTSVLFIYIAIQGLFMTYDFDIYMKTMKNYMISFIFIIMTISLNFKDYMEILKKYCIFGSIFFFIEYVLNAFKFTAIYNILFQPPFQGVRTMANFLSPNSYGTILSLLIILNLYLFIKERKKFNLIFSIGLIMPLISTASKSGLIILVVGIISFMFFNFNLKMKLVTFITTILGLFYVMSDYFIALLYKFNSIYFVTRIRKYLEAGSVLGGRGVEYGKIFKVYKDSWITGLGFGNVGSGSHFYIAMSSLHNEYLRFFIEGGIVGGILFTCIIGILIFAAVKLFLNKDILKLEKALIISFLLMFLMAEFQYNFFNAPRESIVLIFFAFGVINCYCNYFENAKDKFEFKLMRGR